MRKYNNYYTLTILGDRRYSINIPQQILFGGFILLCLMLCFSISVRAIVDLHPLQEYCEVYAQNKSLQTETYRLYQQNYDLAQRNSTAVQKIKVLEAMLTSEDENVIPLNPEYKQVSIEEQNIGWRIFQYKVKIGERILYEYVIDRNRSAEHKALKAKLETIQKNIDQLIQSKQFTPEITIVSLPDKEFTGMAGNLLVFFVSKQDALQMQMDGLEIAEHYKKTLQRELKIAKENRILQETPLIGSIRLANRCTGIEELNKQIKFCQQLNTSLLQSNSELIAQTHTKVMDYRNNYARTPSIQPLRYVEISSPYGYRVHPLTNTVSIHYGLDMVVPLNTKVMATADGRVTFSGWSGSYGNMVQIHHGMGLSTIYGHCAELLVRPGQSVKKGQVIALSGNTGLSNGPHLHYEIRRWNLAIDPTPYLQRDILTANKNW